MTFLPVVERELRVTARRAWTYYDRALFALAATGLFAMMFLVAKSWRSQRELGHALFVALGVFGMVYCLLAGARHTADALSAERRNGTLGLLFLTDLRGWDVVMGKLASSSFTAFYALLAALPVMTVPILLGGVSAREVGGLAVTLVNSLLFSLCLGLAVSSLCRSARAAIVGTVLLVFVFCALPPLLAEEALRWRSNSLRYHLLCGNSPVFSFVLAFDFPRARELNTFWSSVATIHAWAWVFLLFAFWRLPRSWQERAFSARQQRWFERLRLWSTGHAEERRDYRRRALDRNPLFWLDDRYRLQKSLLWALLLAGVTLLAWFFQRHPRDVLHRDFVIGLGACVNHALLLWIAFQSCHRFAEDRQTGALELLLATPISVKAILRGRLLALWGQIGWPMIAVLALECALVAGASLMGRPYYYSSQDAWFVTLAFLGMVLLPLQACAMAWTGLWLSAGGAGPIGATFGVIWRTVLLPWGVFIMAVVAVEELRMFRFLRRVPEEVIFMAWFTWIAGVNVLWWLRARRVLHARFRTLAVERPAPWRPWRRKG